MIFQLIFVQLITFAGLVFVLRKILISSSYKETSRLQQLNEDNAKKSQELASKILDVENEYREKISQAEDEVREMRAKARSEIEELKEALVAKGKAEGEHIIAQALNSKREMRAEIEEEMQERIVETSFQVFQKVLSSQEHKLVYDGLLESVFKELSEVDPEQLKSIDLGGGAEISVDVSVSHSMSDEQKEKLETILSSKINQTIKVQENIKPEVISGIVIMLGSFMIDGSLSGRIRDVAEELK